MNVPVAIRLLRFFQVGECRRHVAHILLNEAEVLIARRRAQRIVSLQGKSDHLFEYDSRLVVTSLGPVDDAQRVFDAGLLTFHPGFRYLLPKSDKVTFSALKITKIADRQRAFVTWPEKVRLLFNDEVEQTLGLFIAPFVKKSHCTRVGFIHKLIVADRGLAFQWWRALNYQGSDCTDDILHQFRWFLTDHRAAGGSFVGAGQCVGQPIQSVIVLELRADDMSSRRSLCQIFAKFTSCCEELCQRCVPRESGYFA